MNKGEWHLFFVQSAFWNLKFHKRGECELWPISISSEIHETLTRWKFTRRSRLHGFSEVAFQTHTLDVFYLCIYIYVYLHDICSTICIYRTYRPAHFFDSGRTSSMSVSSLLLLRLLPLLAALRPGQQTLALTDATDTEEKNVTIEAGTMGAYWDFGSGRIYSVRAGSQADKEGLKVGQHIVRVGTEQYSSGALRKAMQGQTAFNLSVESPSSTAQNAELAILCLAMPAATLSCLLALTLPCLVYSHLFMSSQGHVGEFSKQLSRPLPQIVLLAFMCSKAGFTALEWPYMQSAFIEKLHLCAHVLSCSGLVLGLQLNRTHPAFSKQMDGSRAALLWKMQLGALALCSIVVLFPLVRLIVETVDGQTSWQMMVLVFAGILQYFSLFALTCQMCRIGFAIKQKMVELQNGMPCSEAKFFECVHKPCVEFLQSSRYQLATCGWPLLLLSPFLMTTGLEFYQRSRHLYERPEYPVNWMFAFKFAAQLGVFAFAIALLPFLLSSALKEFKSVLNEELQSNGALHEQIEAVESMFERQNHGQGFGIPVFDGFVITQGWLQMICIRFAILGTAIKAFLDTELGYAKEPEQVLMPHLKDMQNQLNNLTTMLRNYTNHTWHLAQQEKRGAECQTCEAMIAPLLSDFAPQMLWISDCSWNITLDANDLLPLSRRSIIGRMQLPTITWYENALNCN